MAISTRDLRGAIYAKYGTASAFSERIGWNRNKIGNILRGKYIPTIDECAEMASTLEMDERQFCSIFLRGKSPNGDKS